MPSTGRSLFSVVMSSWALLLGFGVLMLGDGLQGTLLGLRASLEGFPTMITGVVMSTFYAGFLLGSIYTPEIVQRVGHIRTFAALASLASASILVHAVFVTPVTWGALRLLSGFCFAGLYVVAESWLNDRAPQEARGQLLSIYMIITYLGVGGGQLLLNFAEPTGYELFILASVLVSVALVPLLLSAGPVPNFDALSPLRLRELYRISPLGVIGAMGTGLSSAAFFGMGAVYGDNIGLSVAEVSIFMTAAVVGCIILQWPIGHLSDKFDRRRVLTIVTLLAGIVAAAAIPVSTISTTGLFLLVCLFGGLSIPLYSLSIAHANDFLEPEQMVAASGSLVLASGIGAILGPLTVSATMSLFGPDGFYWHLAATHAAVGAFALYRMSQRHTKSLEEQGPCAPTTLRMTAVEVELAQHSVLDQLEQDDQE